MIAHDATTIHIIYIHITCREKLTDNNLNKNEGEMLPVTPPR